MKNACMKETIVGGKTLKVKFNQDGKQVKMQILEQDEKLRGQDVIRRNELYAIKSILFPDMSFNTLYIRGLSRNYDTGEVSEVFTSVGKATEYITKISKLIGEINDKAEKEARKTNKSIIINTDGYKVVTATLYGENGEQLRKETAKCSPEDVFDFEVGAKLAVERLFEDKERIVVGDSKLKVEFNRHGVEVIAEVLEMDEALREKESLASGGEYEVFSVAYTEIRKHWLFVRGNEKARDHDKAYFRFDSITEAKEYIENISELIRKINRERKWNAKVVCVESYNPYLFFTKGKIYSVVNGKIKDDRGKYIGDYKSVDEANKALKAGKFIEIFE